MEALRLLAALDALLRFGVADLRSRVLTDPALERRFMALPEAQESASYRVKITLGMGDLSPLWVKSGHLIGVRASAANLRYGVTAQACVHGSRVGIFEAHQFDDVFAPFAFELCVGDLVLIGVIVVLPFVQAANHRRTLLFRDAT